MVKVARRAHPGETQVGRLREQGGKEGFSIFDGFTTVQMREHDV